MLDDDKRWTTNRAHLVWSCKGGVADGEGEVEVKGFPWKELEDGAGGTFCVVMYEYSYSCLKIVQSKLLSD
ncbi:unnamed protein product [Sphenostylis stenocarpa]|uniref:Uncharacterized protein n=1 Tax=Sphenostylis stenocarpa TaxID=92480 RepID=A0AA86W0Q3_9FABA|nr:unnamed protein product [Sphenostylis stenocarpa]